MNSLAQHAHTLFIACPRAIEEADMKEGGWIRSVSRIKRLTVSCTLTVNFSTASTSRSPTNLNLRPQYLEPSHQRGRGHR